jgi:glyceraldehyde 3-phosphate dehydrogenase
MTTKIGINGFGRIGGTSSGRCARRGDLEVVAVNDITSATTLAHSAEVRLGDGTLRRPRRDRPTTPWW